MKFVAFMFIMGSFIGWIMEIGFKFFSGQSLDKAGMGKLPFCALYGTGTLLLYLMISKNTENIILIFLGSMFFLTSLELIAGTILDKIFRLTLWDYTNKTMCINKHICGEFMIFWGSIGVVFIKFLLPFFKQIYTNFDNEIGLVLIVLITLTMIVDYMIAIIYRINNLFNNKVKV